MAERVVRLDQALIDGAEFVARSIGHGDTWDGGLGHVFGRMVQASDVSKRPVSVTAVKARVGLTDENVETARAVFNLGQRLMKGR